ncbi:MAG: succinate--CoA ligase subunit alpha [Bacteroidales bacterium]|nr:succinate--CoA ligase subunit alpha [Bacteroidales bacterium]
MSILVNKNTRVVVQGITGKEATFHTTQMIEYGTKIVAGVSPGKGGIKHINIPVFDSVEEAVKNEEIDASIIFVPAQHAADAILEAADAGIKLIVAITEGIPINDMIKVKKFVMQKGSRLIGPNCPGIITPGECKLGIMPGFIHKKGCIGIISKSGTLTYEAVNQISELNLGQSTCIGIGGDPIVGTSILDAVKLFMEDDETKAIIIIGEIGGKMENEAADWIKENNKKPVFAYIAGKTAPKGKRMGHAGAIIGGKDDTAIAKMEYMRKCNINVIENVANIGKTIKESLNL